MHDWRLSAFRGSFVLALPFVVLSCDLMKKSEGSGGAPSASASNASAPAASTPSEPTPAQPSAIAPAQTPTHGGVAPARLPDGGIASPEGGAWVVPSSIPIPSNLPPMPSHFPIPSNLPPIPSNLPFPRPPPTH